MQIEKTLFSYQKSPSSYNYKKDDWARKYTSSYIPPTFTHPPTPHPHPPPTDRIREEMIGRFGQEETHEKRR